MNKIMGILRILFTPGCWVTVGIYSKDLDEHLIELMKYHKFTNIWKFRATLGTEIFWIENHPFSSFFLYKDIEISPKFRRMPSRITRLRAMDKLNRDKI